MSYLVAVDDGHGMKTPGKRTPKFADGSFMHENEFNKGVVAKLKIILRRCGIGYIATAPTTKDTPLWERVKIANDKKADIFVSVHANAVTGKWGKPSGLETYYCKGSKNGLRLAKAVHNHLVKGTLQKNRGLKTKSMYVTKHTKMPAILCECGFMDNKVEAMLLKSDEFREECAIEIAKGICDYFGVRYING